ncbi:MAG TPA: enoyl-CoA hydratase [Alphaproteobacteria bacterium]|nr:enoyl-CoA hydratase [Alphaproteobacteria bacterium]
MSFETITVERNEAVGVLTLNRPQSMNALCAAMLGEMTEALKQLDSDDSIRAVVLTGAGGCFAAGTDMAEFGNEATFAVYTSAKETLKNFKKPLIAAVAHYAFGGGLELVLASDISIAGDNARFGFPEITIGVLPQLGGVSMLTNRVGRAKANDILMTGRQLSAEEALACGLVSRIVDSAELFEQAMDTAQRIAAMPAAAVRLIKQAVEKTDASDAADEDALARLSLYSSDAKEGLAALSGNRAPKFTHKQFIP